MSLDHGLLNVPLSKRGDIDAQIDRFKEQQARAAAADRRAKAKEMASLRFEAKRIVAAMTAERFAELAASIGTTPGVVRQRMRSNAHWYPKLVIASEGGR